MSSSDVTVSSASVDKSNNPWETKSNTDGGLCKLLDINNIDVYDDPAILSIHNQEQSLVKKLRAADAGNTAKREKLLEDKILALTSGFIIVDASNT